MLSLGRRDVANESYVKRLESVIKQMLTPLKDIPFNLVIEFCTGKKVVPFNFENSEDIKLLHVLQQVAVTAGAEIKTKGIISRRPNEVGNHIEDFVKNAMLQKYLNPQTPTGSSGKKKAVGYPDILFTFNEKPYYLECKTYNLQTISTTQRSFYFSPSDDFKVVHDTHHFILSYEMFEDGRKGAANIYRCKHYKLLSLEALSLDVKYEFNSDNRRMYSGRDGTVLLSEGQIQ